MTDEKKPPGTTFTGPVGTITPEQLQALGWTEDDLQEMLEVERRLRFVLQTLNPRPSIGLSALATIIGETLHTLNIEMWAKVEVADAIGRSLLELVTRTPVAEA